MYCFVIWVCTVCFFILLCGSFYRTFDIVDRIVDDIADGTAQIGKISGRDGGIYGIFDLIANVIPVCV